MKHSYSSLSCWVKCPRQHAALYRHRTHKREPGPALDRGIRIHDALEKHLRGEGGPPDGFWTPPGLLERLREAGAEPEVEGAIDGNGEPCGFWDSGVLLRGKIDVRVRWPTATRLVDWKTGKFYPDALQADVYAVFERAQTGDPKRKVGCTFVYGDQKKIHPEVVDDCAYGRVMRLIERVEADNSPVPKPTPLCGWCPVDACEYHKPRG